MYLSMCHELEYMQFVSIAVNEVDCVRPHITPRTLIIYLWPYRELHVDSTPLHYRVIGLVICSCTMRR